MVSNGRRHMKPRVVFRAILAFLLIGVCIAPAAPAFQAEVTTLLEEVETLVFERINEERAERGLKPLAPEPMLAAIARSHSRDMLERSYTDHFSPDGKGPVQRAGEQHRRLVGEAAENVWSALRAEDASPTELANEIMDGLMASPGHRRNILLPELTHVGLGIYSARGARNAGVAYRATQLFAAVESYTEQPVPERLYRSRLIDFRLRRADGERADVAYFDLWSEEEQRVVHGPAGLVRARIRAAPGTYRLRFYHRLAEGRYRVSSGPYVVVE
jgi:uncharacterized protein YkwD